MRLHHLLSSLPFLLLLSLSDVTAASAADVAPPQQATPGVKPVPPSVVANDFNFAMYGTMKTKSGNLFFSAPSAREALGIAYLGAHGSTASEMANALHLNSNADLSAREGKQEIADFQDAKGKATLQIANRLWSDQRFQMLPAFTTSTTNGYGSSAQTVDFFHQREAARGAINGWVEAQTNHKITNLLPPGSLTPETRLVITNAIYFKGSWVTAFDKKATRDEAFFVDGKTSGSVPVPTMHEVALLNGFEHDGVKGISMPYLNSDYEMDVIMPDKVDGLAAVEAKLSNGVFMSWMAMSTTHQVTVSFPKYTFTMAGSLKGQLGTLGMKSAFSDRDADFTGIAQPTSDGPIYISDVIQKAFIAVDEQGAEAAAATGVIVSTPTAVMLPPPAMTFKADHPFVFAIRDVKHNRVLFMGRVMNPKA